MAKYRMRKRRDGTYNVSCVLGDKGTIRHIGFEKGVKRQELPDAVVRQATLAKAYRERGQRPPVTASVPRVTP